MVTLPEQPAYQRRITLRADNAGCDRAGAPVLRGVSFALHPGEALQLFGANGSGKTSLLALIAGLIPPVEGALHWETSDDDHALIDQPGTGQADQPPPGAIFSLSHEAAVKPALSARENLTFWAAQASEAGQTGQASEAGQARQASENRKQKNAALIDTALASVGMGSLAQARLSAMSAGQRRRVDLARMMLGTREVWLMDEPVAALDEAGKAIVAAAVRAHLARGGLAVIATHETLDVPARRLELVA